MARLSFLPAIVQKRVELQAFMHTIPIISPEQEAAC